MDAANASYLMRYLIILLVAGATALLLIKSIKDFSGGVRRNIKPARGFFLMAPPRQGESRGVRSLPLFHTTVIGKKRSCDIRLRGVDVAGRHASIYLYDGDWYIQPMRPQNKVAINRVKISKATPLRNNDVLDLGAGAGVRLIFVDEEEASARQGLEYKIPYADYLRELRDRPTRSPFAVVLINLFWLLISGLLVWRLSGDLLPLRPIVAAILGGFFIIFNLYNLLLPKLFRHSDRLVWAAVTQLCYLGIIVQLRLTLLRPRLVEAALEDKGGDLIAAALSLILPQLVALAIGLVLLPLVMNLAARTRFLERLYKFCLVITPLMLVLTLILGRGDETHGATLWIRLGGLSLQLTEFAKITYLIVLATFFKSRPQLTSQIRFALWAGLVLFLIMLLPDLGSVMILLPVTLVVYVVMTSEYGTTLAILGGSTAIATVSYALFPHVRRRLAGWTSLWAEVNDSNRQIVYGLQAVTRGGLWGRGIGNGTPDGIPVVASDMVYTVLCEEFGLIIGLAVVCLFIVIWLRGARNMLLVKDGFSSSLILALSSMFFFEAAIVIAGCTGLIPLTGVTLPFISQGGSSLLAKLMMTGVLLGLMARRPEMVVKA